VAAWLSETVLRGRGPGASGFESHRRGEFFPRKEPPPGHGCVCMSSGADGRVVEGRATLFHTKARSAGFKKVPRSPVAHKRKKERKKQADRKVPDRPVRFKGERQLKKNVFNTVLWGRSGSKVVPCGTAETTSLAVLFGGFR
jgi:hypothetical protein